MNTSSSILKYLRLLTRDKWLRHGLAGAAELIWPATCVACARLTESGAPFCAQCAISLEPIAHPCPRCGLPLPGPLPLDGRQAVSCLACLHRPPPWKNARVPFVFDGALATALRRWKLASQPHLTPALGRLLAPSLHALSSEVDVWLPVPLHPRRLRAREFNQSSLLLRAAAAGLTGAQRPEIAEVLDRVRDTPPQATLKAPDRLRNLRGAFRLAPGRSIMGCRLGLVDDVMTTGATMHACTEVLLEAGARSVLVVALARAVL